MSLYSVAQEADVVVVKFPKDIDTAGCQELLSLVKQWVPSPAPFYIFDCVDVQSIHDVAFRPFALVHRALKNVGGLVITVGLTPVLQEQFNRGGLGGIMSFKSTMGEAMAETTPKSLSNELDMNFINPFILAVKSTLEIQASTPVELGAHYMKNHDEIFNADIAGVISLASKKYNGSLAVCFPAAVFLNIYSNMLGEKVNTITREMEDAAGELLNMIFGVAKAELNNNADAEIQRAIPAIVRGEQLRIHHLSRGSVLVVPCKTSTGEFQFEMSMEPV